MTTAPLGRLLVVDDEADLLDVLTEKLKKALERWADDRGLTPSAADRMILTQRLTMDGYLTERSEEE